VTRHAFTTLAGGAASASLISAVLAGHGTAGLIIAATTVGAMALLRAVAPELFWLAALILAIREQRWARTQLSEAEGELRRQILACNPAIEIARARACGSVTAAPAKVPSPGTGESGAA
jgi:D-serine deaminase-like pyridoxal phosphate-dependent protein